MLAWISASIQSSSIRLIPIPKILIQVLARPTTSQRTEHEEKVQQQLQPQEEAEASGEEDEEHKEEDGEENGNDTSQGALQHLATFLHPEILGTPLNDSYPDKELWEDVAYFGAIPEMLALVGAIAGVGRVMLTHCRKAHAAIGP